MIKVKICGITSLREISYLNILKPDYVGFVFAKSKRQIEKSKCKILSDLLIQDIKKVGVFRNNSIEEILEVVNYVSLDVIQIHGDENNEYIKNLRKALDSNIAIWKAILIDEKVKKVDLKKYKSLIENFVLDGVSPGSGRNFNWNNTKLSSDIKFFLAGGINEENVLDAIKILKPNGIDVSSGVESINENGERLKSFYKMKDLIMKVRKN
ncbi:phosphoribosylanthranilate isomerase [Clostridium aquiflavi]|uniref:N-(5'-phosphoribosyl)anthranilate isomerase n=1 Tax=Clostridium aquiflavi TaxID=3073603 RepID=A0ABU1EK03_9CLOT|nr:phosphoribosylanthranilate isomerase [Clostridium sp. 5N-1]MDR5588720.1 phosphoribosylanthranilate isomerase [Clostridium sp. 5N-1]